MSVIDQLQETQGLRYRAVPGVQTTGEQHPERRNAVAYFDDLVAREAFVEQYIETCRTTLHADGFELRFGGLKGIDLSMEPIKGALDFDDGGDPRVAGFPFFQSRQRHDQRIGCPGSEG